MTYSNAALLARIHNDLRLKKLTAEQIEQIDMYLASIEEYGEVHLIIQHGELRYINKVESHKAWKDGNGEGNQQDG